MIIHNEKLASLLANEGITIQIDNSETASFDLKTRVMTIPNWVTSYHRSIRYVSHEAAHAKWTPLSGWHRSTVKFPKAPRSFINILEDVRIERLMQDAYPGLIKDYRINNQENVEDNIFRLPFTEMNLIEDYISRLHPIDKINLRSKSTYNVIMNDEEEMYWKRANETKKFQEVVKLAGEIYERFKRDDNEENKNNRVWDDDDSAPGNTFESYELYKNATKRKVEYINAEKGNGTSYWNIDEFSKLLSLSGGRRFSHSEDSWNVIYRNAIKSSKPLIKYFSRYRNANNYSKTEIKRTGEISPELLHSYRVNDKIFKNVDVVSKQENHRCFFLVDFSFSMKNVILDTIQQICTLYEFCKCSGVEFYIYGYTSSNPYVYNDYLRRNERTFGEKHVATTKGSLKPNLFEIATSDYSNKRNYESLKNLYTFLDSYAHYDDTRPFNLASTPTINALLRMDEIFNSFKDDGKTTSLTVLSDGIADRINLNELHHTVFKLKNSTIIPDEFFTSRSLAHISLKFKILEHLKEDYNLNVSFLYLNTVRESDRKKTLDFIWDFGKKYDLSKKYLDMTPDFGYNIDSFLYFNYLSEIQDKSEKLFAETYIRSIT